MILHSMLLVVYHPLDIYSLLPILDNRWVVFRMFSAILIWETANPNGISSANVGLRHIQYQSETLPPLY